MKTAKEVTYDLNVPSKKSSPVLYVTHLKLVKLEKRQNLFAFGSESSNILWSGTVGAESLRSRHELL